MADSLIYLRIYLGGAVFLFIYNTLNGIYNALGDSKTQLYFLMLSNLTNIVLDPVSYTHLQTAGRAQKKSHSLLPAPAELYGILPQIYPELITV